MARKTIVNILRTGLQRYARSCGYDVRRALPTPMETVAALLGAENVRVCFDVGAFRGEYALDMTKVFPHASVYAYEPNPVEFQRLASAAGPDSRIIAIACGMGRRVATAKLHVTAGTASSSLLPVEHDAVVDWGNSLTESTATTVNVVTIDSEIERIGIETVDFIKIDAQGFESEILAGAAKSFQARRIRALQIEMLVEKSYVGQAMPHELLTQCHDLGLRLRGIYDTYYRDSRLMQFDALLTVA